MPMAVCTVASADVEYAYTMTDGVLPEGFTVGSTTLEPVEGFAGKAASDTVLKYTNPNDSFFYGGGLAGTDKDNNVIKKYYVLKFNYIPANGTSLNLRTGNNNPLVTSITSNKFNLDKWNSVVIYVDYSEIDPNYDYTTLLSNSQNLTSPLIPDSEKPSVCPKGYVYINGVLSEAGFMTNRLQDRFGMWNTYYYPTLQADGTRKLITATSADTTLRFNITKNGTAYIDDLYIYQTNEKPDAAALSAAPVPDASDKYTVDGETLKINVKSTVADIKAAAGGLVSAYTDETLATALADSAELSNGNAIVLEKDSKLAYYTVELQYKSMTDGTIGTTFTSSFPTTTPGVAGFAGKEADDKVLYVYGAGNIGGGGLAAADANHLVPDNKKYYVLKFNYMPADSNSKLFLRSENNDAVIYTVGNALFDAGKWNSVVIYVDYSAIKPITSDNGMQAVYDDLLTRSETYAKTDKTTVLIPDDVKADVLPVGHVFVNGEEVVNPYMPTRLNGRFGMYNTYWYPSSNPYKVTANVANTTFRLGFGDAATNGGYIDDLYIYQTGTAPDAAALSALPTVTATDKITADGENLCVEIGTTVADVQAAAGAGCTVKAYTDSEYKNKIASNAKLYAGDKIVIEKDSKYAYYTVANAEVEKTLTNGVLENGFGVSNASGVEVTTADGSMGKDVSDKTLKLEQIVAGTDSYINGGGLISVDKNNKVTSKYYVLKFNYKPTNDTGLALRTANGGNVMTPVAYTKFKQNEWNSVVIYVDYSGLDENYDYTQLWENSKNFKNGTIAREDLIPMSERPKVCPVGYAYVNGVANDAGFMADRLQDRYGMNNTYYHPTSGALTEHANNDFRLSFGNTAIGKSAEIDDLYVYQTDVLPDAAALSALPTLKTEDANTASVNGNVVTAKAGVTAAAVASTDGRVTFFKGTNVTDTIEEDTLISVVGPNGAISAYKASIFSAAADGVTVTANVTDALAGSTLFIAEYEGGELVKVTPSTAENVNAETGTLSFSYTKAAAANTVRVFLFENATTIKPLSGSIDLN